MKGTGRQRVALVAPFFGRELRGRKERFAFAYATRTPVLTTGSIFQTKPR